MKPDKDVFPQALDLVRLPQAFATVPIFVPLQRGQKRCGMDVTLRAGRTELRVRAYEQLGIGDQDVLVALLRLAEFREQTALLGRIPATEIGQGLRDGLEIEWWTGARPASVAARKRRRGAVPVVPEDESMVITTSVPELARRAGKATGGKGRKVIEGVLERLMGVSIKTTDTETGSWVYSHLIHSVRYSAEGERLRIAIHPMLARVLLGAAGAVTRIDEADYLSLDGEVAKRLLIRLCSWVNAGTARSVWLDTLAAGVWPDPPANNANGRGRRRRLAGALQEIDRLDTWAVAITGAGSGATARITRSAGSWQDGPRKAQRSGSAPPAARGEP